MSSNIPKQIVYRLLESEPAERPDFTRAVLVAYRPIKNGPCQFALACLEGQVRPALAAAKIRQALEQLVKRRLAWSQYDLSIADVAVIDDRLYAEIQNPTGPIIIIKPDGSFRLLGPST